MNNTTSSLNLESIKAILNKHYVYSKAAGSRFFDLDTAAEELLKRMGDASARKDEEFTGTTGSATSANALRPSPATDTLIEHICGGRTDSYGGFTCVVCGKHHAKEVASSEITVVDDTPFLQSGGLTGPDNAIAHYTIHEKDGEQYIVFGSEERPANSPMYVDELRRAIGIPYSIAKPENDWREISSFSSDEKKKLRPIAETLAMLDGNAFFGNTVTDDREWYESYLPEAAALYENNGGDTGWGGQASFIKRELGAKNAEKIAENCKELAVAAESAYDFLDSRHSDTDFDADNELASVHAALYVAIYNYKTIIEGQNT